MFDSKNTVYKEKIDKFHFVKIKNFCFASYPFRKMKKQALHLDKKFANHVSDKETDSILNT